MLSEALPYRPVSRLTLANDRFIEYIGRMQSTDASYAPPQVIDYGTLRDWTGSHHLYVGKQIVAAAAALSVTVPTGGGGGGGTIPVSNTPGGVAGATGGGFNASGVLHTAAGTSTPSPGDVLGATGGGLKGAGTTGVAPGSVIAAHGGGTGGGGGGKGSLPFTGMPVVITASIGAGVASAGAWARWATRRGGRPNTPL